MAPQPVTRLTVYGHRESGNCLKIKWLADTLGLAYDWVDIDFLAGDTKSEDFLALNPVGLIPFARWPDGRGLPESNAIMLYLADAAGSHLIPEDGFRRAQMMSWLFWEQYSHEPNIAVRRSLIQLRGMSEDELDPQLLAKGRRALGVMELQLTHTDWLVGETMTLADIALVAYTRLAPEGGFDLDEFPAVKRWVSRVETELDLPHAVEAVS